MAEAIEYTANPKKRRIMQEEYWAALNEAIWESRVATLKKKNAALTKENAILAKEIKAQTKKIKAQAKEKATLQRLLKQQGIENPPA